MPNYTNSVWSEATPAPPYPPLAGNETADVAVVGGGVTGITAALLLARAGRRVAVIEARRIGKGESGKTTAHLTEALDQPYHVLISRFGLDGARLAANGQRAAIERIATFADECAIACDFQRMPGYAYAETRAERAELEREAAAARRLGLDTTLVERAPLPFPITGALRFDDQATIHPRAYLQGLERAFVGLGGRIFEDTQVVAIDEGDPCRVISDRGVVAARDVIVAAHVPIVNRVLLHAKLAAYRSYVVGVDLSGDAGIGDGLYWDMGTPYHYIRSHTIGGRRFLIVGGEDHKVGDADDTTAPFARLESFVRVRFGRDVAPTDYRWSGQIVVSADGLPYVGRNSMSHDVFVATGYAGNGMTQGTLAAMVLTDEICGLANPLAELLDATRIKPLASAGAVLAENLDFPRHLLTDRLTGRGDDGEAALAAIPPGEGQVLSLGGERLAVYRNANGQLGALSPKCTHLGCLVHWNTTEKSWDCPCHGSRFDPHGRVLNGPAVTPLEARAIPDEEREPDAVGHDLHEHAATD
ncbi:MAG TPA: FAD-dependent oxidoreductase [Polyangia bacterium]|nr:FAD-dependent oxidoreductase [Polyangia bacterium]